MMMGGRIMRVTFHPLHMCLAQFVLEGKYSKRVKFNPKRRLNVNLIRGGVNEVERRKFYVFPSIF
jgi:hypothetical protein